MSTATKAVRTLVAAGTSNAAGGVTRGTTDQRTALGGLLTMKITNQGTYPTTPCAVNVMVAHNTGTTPTAASAGTDWKTHWQWQAGTPAYAVYEQSIPMPVGAMHICVEFTGNTGYAVTVEAYYSEVSSIA